MHQSSFLLSAFVTLLVTIGPIETAAIYGVLTSGVHRPERRRLAMRAVVIAGIVLVIFALAGNLLLGWLHVTLPAFRVAGGVLLFLQALTLTFSNPGLSSISEHEKTEAQTAGDIAVFPLAFPLIAGPGALSAIVLLMGQAQGDLLHAAVILAMLAAILMITLLALIAVEPLTRLLGATGIDVVGRISGVLLAALAVQFIFDGLTEALRLSA